MASHKPLLEGKKILITGVLTSKSLAFAIAEACQKAGATILLTSFGRVMPITQTSAQRLSPRPEVIELDVMKSSDFHTVADYCRKEWGSIDGVVHSVGYAPPECLGGGFLSAPWESVQIALHASAFSFAEMISAFTPLMEEKGGSFVTLTFDARVAWPLYDWMGPAKAALESISRYATREVGRYGIRVNAIAAGPLQTMAARSIPGFDGIKDLWDKQAPLGWDSKDPTPVADTAVFLLSRWARAVSGEIIHVDGGYHAMGAPMHVDEKQSHDEGVPT